MEIALLLGSLRVARRVEVETTVNKKPALPATHCLPPIGLVTVLIAKSSRPGAPERSESWTYFLKGRYGD
jgi:hypothetical protein